MNHNDMDFAAPCGKLFLGIEFGSTRIKAVLIDDSSATVASGSHDWENTLADGIWTYPLEEARAGMQSAYAALAKDYNAKTGRILRTIDGFGVSAMMHGYLAFDKDDNLLVPFRTWRNTITGQAAEQLTGLFRFNIPQRWSIAHLYQAILGKEEHVGDVAFITTLAGYIHAILTGEKVLGVGDASGVFPVDSTTGTYDAAMIGQFDALTGIDLGGILPRVLMAGETAGRLTEAGALLLDPTGALCAGVPFCPPEGDAGTGMVATNSVAPRTGNVSAGTSVFAMTVLEKALTGVYPEIDIVTTPSGSPVAMVHCNNCTSDLDAWVGLLGEAARSLGANVSKAALYDTLYYKALESPADCDGLLSYNYLSGEHLTGFEQGRPLFVRSPDSRLTLAGFMRCLLYSSMSTLRLGMDILLERENVGLDVMNGHGGLFKTEGVGQRIMAAALGVPIAVMESAGEGGAWGIALLAAYMSEKTPGLTLGEYLTDKVFAGKPIRTVQPDPKDVEGFSSYISRYSRGLEIERSATLNM